MAERARQRQIPLLIASVLLCLWTVVAASGASRTPNLIPLPVACETRDGSFVITPATRIVAEGDVAGAEAAKLIESLSPAMGFRLAQADAASATEQSIRLRIDPSLKDRLGDEGYALDVTPTSIEIRAAASAGLFYGGQTLRQLLPPEILRAEKVDGVRWLVPCVRIADSPRFVWRGLLIDPARHFIPVADFKRFIDVMTLHKFNRLQVHFTD
ncbi:MAG: glycoside hydrolase family 20 zincin-like fold domain-containing protein, partial [Solirubrobacterales bacterium]